MLAISMLSYLYLPLPPFSMQSFRTNHYEARSMMKIMPRLLVTCADTNI